MVAQEEILRRAMEIDERLGAARQAVKSVLDEQAAILDELEQACGLQLWAVVIQNVPQWRWYRRVSGSRFSQYFDTAHEAYTALLEDRLEWQE